MHSVGVYGSSERHLDECNPSYVIKSRQDERDVPKSCRSRQTSRSHEMSIRFLQFSGTTMLKPCSKFLALISCLSLIFLCFIAGSDVHSTVLRAISTDLLGTTSKHCSSFPNYSDQLLA